MSDLKDRIIDEVKTAMRARSKERLATLRLIQAAIKQKEVDERVVLDDHSIVSLLDKMSKQHQDSIQQFEKADRDDLVQKERSELAIVEEFLPPKFTESEIATAVQDAISKVDAKSAKDMGKVMKVLKSELQGRADMGKVSGMVKQKLSS